MSADAQELLQAAANRSPVVRGLLDRLERSDVVAYVRFASFAETTLEGRVGFVSFVAGRRYVVIELACMRVRQTQIATLAHELQHAAEIADAPSIVDTRSLAEHYQRIGMRMTSTWGQKTFETQATLDTATQARREILSATLRTAEEE